MLKSSRLVLALGTLLGASVAVLPATSFAATSITHSTDTVSATINGYLSFTEVSHTPGTTDGTKASTYDSTNKRYTGTFNLMDSTNNFGTTTYEVTCNYLSGRPYVLDVNDSDGDGNTTETIQATSGSHYSSYVNTDCSQGWHVSAVSTNVDNGYAVMVPSNNSNSFKIKSTSAALSSTSANWKLKTAPVAISGQSVTYGSETKDAAALVALVNNMNLSANTSYADFNIVPYSATDVAAGKTIVTADTFVSGGDSSKYVYLGPQRFAVTYGLTAGMDAVADTYTGEITYTLYINAAS